MVLVLEPVHGRVLVLEPVHGRVLVLERDHDPVFIFLSLPLTLHSFWFSGI